LLRKYLLKQVIEGNMDGRIEVKERLRRRHIQFVDDLKERRGHRKLKEEVSDGAVWRTRFGRGCGPLVRQTTRQTNM